MAHFQLKIKMYRRLYSRDPLSLNRAISLVEMYVIQTEEIKSPRFNIRRYLVNRRPYAVAARTQAALENGR